MSKVVNLSEKTEFKIGSLTLTVYPATLQQIMDVTPKLESLAKVEDMKKQAGLFIDIIFELIKDYNEGLKKPDLQKTLSLKGGVKIIQTAIGSDSFLNESITKNA